GLPAIDGYLVAEHIRALPENGRTMIVAVSGYGQEQDRLRSKSVGFDYPVVKPIDPAVLAGLVGSLRLSRDGAHAGPAPAAPDSATSRSTARRAPLRPVRYSAFGQATLGDIAERAFARAAGGAAIAGNAVRLLCDARENFPAWREALTNAKKYILFEQYIVENDDIGREFAQILADRARAGVKVYAIVAWLRRWRGLSLWRSVREAGADIRVFNPPRLSSPLGWLSRDHRKTIVVDGQLGFVSGLCLSERWLGNPKRRLEPWRDTGIAIRGPAVAALEQAFTAVFAASGNPLDTSILTPGERSAPGGPSRLQEIAHD